jgi:hypothetical protein
LNERGLADVEQHSTNAGISQICRIHRDPCQVVAAWRSPRTPLLRCW